MSTATQKGDALESAVAAIERHILASSHGLREKTFLIECKKTIDVGGVHHEIDIFVTIDLGQGYKSIFIFECKNWQVPVNKNEVIIFSEKINAAEAQRGFLVGRSFTKDAQMQAAKDARITVLPASEHDPEAAPVPFGFHGIVTFPEHTEATFFKRGGTHLETTSVVIGGIKASLLGNTLDVGAYLRTWAEQPSSESVLSFRSERLPEGTYDRVTEAIREFEAGSLLVDGLDIERISISVRFKVKVVRPSVISYFEVESRGRALTFAPIELPTGANMHMSLVSSP